MSTAGFDVGAFQTTGLLGKGGMGKVWAATHRVSGLTVALKVMSPDTARTPSFVTAFATEVRAVARLDHPNVVAVFDHGWTSTEEAAASAGQLLEGSPYLAMEVVRGGTLSAHRGRLSWPQLSEIIQRLLDALGHAHARGVVHRDLKLGNVLVGKDLHDLRLTDFGLAALAQQPTESGEKCPWLRGGTPSYMAPEQINGSWRAVGPWTDLYGFGAVCYTLASGRSPFRAGSSEATMRAHLQDPVPPLPPHATSIRGFDSWLQRLMQKDPRRRFTSAAEARAAFDALPGPARLVIPRSGDAQQARTAPEPLRGRGLGLTALREPPLVGRSFERQQLWDLYRQTARDGRARLALLSGRSGTGKSRLARWLAVRAHQSVGGRSIHAVHSLIPNEDTGLAAALIRYLRCAGLARTEVGAHLGQLLGPAGDEAQEVERLNLIAPDEQHTAAPAARHLSLSRILAELAPRVPVVLLVDDVQWGSDALEFARAMLGRPVPVVMVMTIKSEALAASHRRVQQALTALSSQPGVCSMDVAPLPAEQRLALVDGILCLSPELARAVASQTDGYPIYAVQLVREWAARGLLRPGEEGFELAPGADISLPTDLHTVWTEALSRVLRGARRSDWVALELAAVLGERVSLDEWRTVCQRSSCQPSRRLLGSLVSGNLVSPRARSFAFAHGMLRDSLERRAREAGRLQAHHLACAALLADRTGGRRAERMALHLVYGGEPERALSLLLEAAEKRRGRWDAARSRELLDHHREALVAAKIPANDRRHSEGMIQRCRLEGSLGSPDREAEEARKLMAHAQERGWPRALCFAQLSLSAVARRQGRSQEALRIAAEASAAAESLGDHELIAQGAWERGLCLTNRGDLIAATNMLVNAREAAKKAGKDVLLAGILLSLGYSWLHRRQVSHAKRCVGWARRLYQGQGVRVGLANCANARGEILRLEGDFLGAARAYRESIEGHAGTSQLYISRLNLGICLSECQEPAAALKIFETSLLELKRMAWENLIGAAHCLALPCTAELGDWAAWDRHLAGAEDSLCRSGLVDQDIERATARAASLARAAGQLDRAAHAAAIARLQGLERKS